MLFTKITKLNDIVSQSIKAKTIEGFRKDILTTFQTILKDLSKKEIENQLNDIDTFINSYKYDELQLTIIEIKKNILLNLLESILIISYGFGIS